MENMENAEKIKGDDATKRKKRKPGIVYLSSIAKYMNIAKIREIFSVYGKVGKIYLQLAENESELKSKRKGKGKGKGRKNMCVKSFTEGWVEFESKKVAKYVAFTLNNAQISTRKKSKFYDAIWNIKYLPRFKWIHLCERLAYERANVDRSRKLREKQSQDGNSLFVPPMIKQRDTDAEIRSRKKGEPTITDRTVFLQSLFGETSDTNYS
ncbi:Pre-rRNA-processing protein esf2 [Anthophora quadrimaculata]